MKSPEVVYIIHHYFLVKMYVISAGFHLCILAVFGVAIYFRLVEMFSLVPENHAFRIGGKGKYLTVWNAVSFAPIFMQVVIMYTWSWDGKRQYYF